MLAIRTSSWGHAREIGLFAAWPEGGAAGKAGKADESRDQWFKTTVEVQKIGVFLSFWGASGSPSPSGARIALYHPDGRLERV